MKRVFSVCYLFVLCLTLFCTFFSMQKKSEVQAYSNSLYFDETTIKNQKDIISAQTFTFFAETSFSTNQAPYDEKTGERMQGYVYTPNTDDYNQINITLPVSSFNINIDQSIFVWIYIPDDYISGLKLSLNSAYGEVAVWEIDSGELTEILENVQVDTLYGWKLFEFSLADAHLKVSSENIESQNITNVSLSYKNDNELLKKYSNNKLSFYHMFLGDSKNDETSVIKTQRFVIYKFNEKFSNSAFCAQDTISFESESDIFSMLFVGKYDLLNIVNPNYSWRIKISEEAIESSTEISLGEDYTIKNKGWLNIKLILSERLVEFSENLFAKQIQFYVDDFNLGSFQTGSLTVKKGESRLFVFYFSKSFDYISDFSASISDKKVATITNYYVKDAVGYVVVEGLETGDVVINVQANGKRIGGEEDAKVISVSDTLQVLGKKNNSVSKTIMWIIFGIYCVSLFIFVIISFVNARRFSVK